MPIINNVDIVLVEVKTTLKVAHVKHFIKKVEKFHRFFKRYRDMTTYGAVAALRMEQASDEFASKRGLFVVKVGGDGMTQIINILFRQNTCICVKFDKKGAKILSASRMAFGGEKILRFNKLAVALKKALAA